MTDSQPKIKRKGRENFELPEDIVNAIKVIKAKTRISKSAITRMALHKYLMENFSDYYQPGN